MYRKFTVCRQQDSRVYVAYVTHRAIRSFVSRNRLILPQPHVDPRAVDAD